MTPHNLRLTRALLAFAVAMVWWLCVVGLWAACLWAQGGLFEEMR
jgi:hypothetical protein